MLFIPADDFPRHQNPVLRQEWAKAWFYPTTHPDTPSSADLDSVATRGYTATMKKKNLKYQSSSSGDLTLYEDTKTAEPETVVNVRSAKDRLSSLLDQAAQGNEVVITSGGVPKARLVPALRTRRPFQVGWKLLQSIKSKPESPQSEELIRRDRDGRP